MSSSRPVLVHGSDTLRRTLDVAEALAVRATVISGPGGQIGPGWWTALTASTRSTRPGPGFDAILDCGDAPGLVMAAFRLGLRDVVFTGDAVTAERLVALAAELGGTVRRVRPEALDPWGLRDPGGSLREWLVGGARTDGGPPGDVAKPQTLG